MRETSVLKSRVRLPASERGRAPARPPTAGPPASLRAYLADQLGDSQSSVDLLQAIEIPQGQVQLVQERALVAGRLGRGVWAQQVIGTAAERLPAKTRTSLGARGNAGWSEDIVFPLKIEIAVDFQGLCIKTVNASWT